MELALSAQEPVVALESTIITHGMPYPQNLETAVEVEQIIRKEVNSKFIDILLNRRHYIVLV